jgi:ribosomal protein L37AE/L43A
MELLYPSPKCKFGRRDMIVPAQYVTCTEHPLAVDEIEGRHANRSAMCLACENNPANSAGPEIVPFSVSLTGDFTDTDDSEPFRYYTPTTVTGIYPRYGPKDGDTFVQVWGENFLNMDQDLRCNFGSKSTVGHFVNSGYITCRTPSSDVVGAGIPFSVSLNKQ